MKRLKMFCLCLNNQHLEQIKQLNYVPVGVGNENFSSEFLRDNTKKNISWKNKNYGEYTFHYWFWKNMLKKVKNNTWIGFCTYRRFWQKKKNINIKNKLENIALKTIPPSWDKYQTIIGNNIDLSNVKWMKVIKYGKIALLRNPLAILKPYRSIRFQFDMFHGNGILDKAIKLLNNNDRDDFKNFTKENTEYNQGNMFISKNKKIIENYYQTTFEWLEKCERVFGFKLYGYGKTRVYSFLAERFLPYWFKKNSKFLEWPIFFYNPIKND